MTWLWVVIAELPAGTASVPFAVVVASGSSVEAVAILVVASFEVGLPAALRFEAVVAEVRLAVVVAFVYFGSLALVVFAESR